MFGKNKTQKTEVPEAPLEKIEGSFQDNDDDVLDLGDYKKQDGGPIGEPIEEPIEVPEEVEEQVGRTMGEIINNLVEIDQRLKEVESWAFRTDTK